MLDITKLMFNTIKPMLDTKFQCWTLNFNAGHYNTNAGHYKINAGHYKTNSGHKISMLDNIKPMLDT